ncbi:MAG: hypothetical protein ABR558_11185 [Thioalkalivibrio sp.]
MSEQTSPPEDSNQPMSVVKDIVQHLREHPFLLITIAGLVVLSGVMVFDIDKLREFKWLFVGVVLVPVFLQFLLVFCRQQAQQRLEQTRLMAERQPQPAASPTPPASPAAAAATVSNKAWWALGLGVFVLLAAVSLDEGDWLDVDILNGLLFFCLVTMGLGLWAIGDTLRKPVRGRGIAITGVVLAGFTLLATLGYMMEL